MKLLTKQIKAKLLHNHATFDHEQGNYEKEKVVCKFFNPMGAGTWFCHSMDEDGRIFGYAHITDGEWGSFSIHELQNLKLPLGLSIERDILFDNNDVTFEEPIKQFKGEQYG